MSIFFLTTEGRLKGNVTPRKQPSNVNTLLRNYEKTKTKSKKKQKERGSSNFFFFAQPKRDRFKQKEKSNSVLSGGIFYSGNLRILDSEKKEGKNKNGN
jgi:hypothetical protein